MKTGLLLITILIQPQLMLAETIEALRNNQDSLKDIGLQVPAENNYESLSLTGITVNPSGKLIQAFLTGSKINSYDLENLVYTPSQSHPSPAEGMEPGSGNCNEGLQQYSGDSFPVVAVNESVDKGYFATYLENETVRQIYFPEKLRPGLVKFIKLMNNTIIAFSEMSKGFPTVVIGSEQQLFISSKTERIASVIGFSSGALEYSLGETAGFLVLKKYTAPGRFKIASLNTNTNPMEINILSHHEFCEATDAQKNLLGFKSQL